MLESTARLSADLVYRYDLWRRWSPGPLYAMFIGLNPSTADESKDDPTIRRCMAFARQWGYSALCMTNLFAIRATNPKVMMDSRNPVGDDNDWWLKSHAKQAGIIIAAWGVNGAFRGSGHMALHMLREAGCQVHHLGLTKYGYPKHPLYLKADTKPILWEGVSNPNPWHSAIDIDMPLTGEPIEMMCRDDDEIYKGAYDFDPGKEAQCGHVLGPLFDYDDVIQWRYVSVETEQLMAKAKG